jgi:uncharacterized membrane protein
MPDSSPHTFGSDFKRFFLRGLVVLLPSVLTLWIVVKAYQFIDGAIAEPINSSVRLSIAELARYWEPLRDKFDPDEAQLNAAMSSAGGKNSRDMVRVKLRGENIQAWWAARWYMDLIGLVVAVIAVYFAGRLLGGFLGRRVYRRVERLITTLPVLKQVYPYVKQIVDFLFGDDKQIKFSRVVVVEYPRKGIWSVGFQTGSAIQQVEELAGSAVTIFIPSSPTPFTGYTITVPRRDVLELPMTVEEAIRFVVSGGVLAPPRMNAQVAADAASASLPADGLLPIPVPNGDDVVTVHATTVQVTGGDPPAKPAI